MNTIVVSDLHIGDSRADANLPLLLRTIDDLAAPDSHLVLNGDTFDLAVCFSLDGRHQEFISVARKHGMVTCVQGNHDWILGGLGRSFKPGLVCCQEMDMVVHGRTFRILHGHQSDFISNRLPRLNRMMICLNHWIASATGLDLQMKLRATWMGRKMLDKQESRILSDNPQVDVLVAGHTHRPGIRQVGNQTYINTGDWIERSHCSYLLLREDGTFELVTLGS